MIFADAKRVTPSTGPKRAATRFKMAVIAACLLTTACAGTMENGTDAGCISYGEARLDQPRHVPVPADPWGDWILDTDDRMTGTCVAP